MADHMGERTDPVPARPGVPREKVRPPAPLGIARPRLTAMILGPPAGLRLVVGPAGSGKTTALAHAADAFGGRCVWLSLDGTDRHPAGFTRSLSAATGLGPDSDVLGVVAALDDGDPTLVVVDDVHEVAGSPTGEAIDLLSRYRPPQVTIAIGARDLRELHQWRWRSDPSALTVDVDQLRFRLWEVDELFRHLGAPLAPVDVHALARRTEGWAVALRLFHIVLRDAPGDASSLLARSPRFTHRSIRGYLREEVLTRITPEQRAFLSRTAVLDRLRGPQCDELLGRSGSAALLEELAAGGLLVPDPDSASYRQHELLRDHLLGELAAEVGDDSVASLHRKAAELLEREGAVRDAVRSAARAGDWDRLRRLLRHDPGEQTPTLHGVVPIPSSVRDHDPWVLRSEAMRQLGEGDLPASRETLRSAVERFAETGGDPGADNLLRAVNAWLQPTPGPARSWVAALRAALAGREVASWPSDQGGRFARGVSDLVAGRVGDARSSLLAASAGSHPVLGAMAAVGLAVAARLGGTEDGAGERAAVLARMAEAPAVAVAAEVVTSGIALTDAGRHPPTDVAMAFEAFFLTLVHLAADEPPVTDLARAEAVLGEQSLVAPLAVVRAARLVQAWRDGEEVDARAARDPSLRAAGPLPLALALLAVGLAHDDPAARDAAHRLAAANGFRRWFEAVAGGTRTAGAAPRIDVTAPVDAGASVSEGHGPPPLVVDVLGNFVVCRNGEVLDLAALRPRHLELLQVLAVNANQWIHRETLWELLWPDRPSEAAAHNLHVAVSAVRRLLEPEALRGQSCLLRRNGDRYRLEVALDHCDVCRFERLVQRTGDECRSGHLDAAFELLRRAVREWRGEPVPAAGPVDWAVGRRDELRRRFAEVALELLSRLTPSVESSALAARAVGIEPSDDLLWRQAIDHARQVGAVARLSELEWAYGQRADAGFGAGIGGPGGTGRRLA